MASKEIDVLRFANGVPMHPDWQEECTRWRGVILRGWFAHYCHDWDGLPVDETTTEEFPDCCTCYA